MDLFIASLIHSFTLLADPWMILFILLGVAWGCIAGALPGVGPNLAVGVALPFTFGVEPIYAVCFLVTINCAVSYGNSIPAILVGVPGTTSAVLTAMDGYALHKRGESGLALGVQYYGAVFGQFMSLFFFLAMVVPLSKLTFIFLSPELFALYFLGCTAVVCIAGENVVKGILSAAFGLAVALAGRDPISQVLRFDYHVEMRMGLEIMPAAIGILAVSELFRQMRQAFSWGELAEEFKAKFPALHHLKRVTGNVIQGTLIGTFIGAIPGIGGNTAAFISYTQSKIWSKHPEEYGKGSIEGIASNEAAQNASQAGEMVPTFGLGIPGSSTMVLLFGALLMHGFVPGPMLIQHAPQLLYSSGAALLGTSIVLALCGWPMARLLLKVVTLNRAMILTGSLLLCMVGIFALKRSFFDVFLLMFFGVIGYFMMRYGYVPAGTSIAMVLGRGFENYLRKGLLLCGSSIITFVTRPYTALILAISLGIFVYGAYGTIKNARRAARVRRESLLAYTGKNTASGEKPHER